MKELIKQEADKQYKDWLSNDMGETNSSIREGGFIAGAEFVASLYPCTPDEVKEMREILEETISLFEGMDSNYIEITSTILDRSKNVLAMRIENLLKDK